jgi:hypothetical protein
LANDSVEYGLGFNTNINKTFDLKLFSGAIYNSNQMKIYIQIYDNDGAFTTYDLPQFITVSPDTRNLPTTITNLIRKEPTDKLNIILNEGFLIESTQEIQRISSLLNAQSLSDKFGLILSKNAPLYPQVYGPLMNFSGVIEVKK